MISRYRKIGLKAKLAKLVALWLETSETSGGKLGETSKNATLTVAGYDAERHRDALADVDADSGE